jgi:LSD1 subclass zinc finger protein
MAGGRKKALARAAQLAANVEPHEKPAVAPLLCPACSAPVPLGDGDVATCSFCQAKVPLPPEYRAIRDAEQQRTTDRDAAEKLYRELGSPPSRALRRWASFVEMTAGVMGGVITVLLMISAVFLLFAGFALEFLLHWCAGLFGIDLIDRFGGGTVYAAFVIIVVGFGLFPTWLLRYLDSLAEIKRTLQVSLAARPPEKPGFPSTCRGCGAALDVPPGAFGVRCAYCQSDNIVSLQPGWISSRRTTQATFHKSIITAVELANKIRGEARGGFVTAVKWSLGAVVVFGLIGRGCTSLDSDTVFTDFSKSMSSPRKMISYWAPDEGVPIDKTFELTLRTYSVALRHREVLVWSSRDDGWGGQLEIKNTCSFPFLEKSWERPWLQQTDGTYAAAFKAPYTGIFVVELQSGEIRDLHPHLRWHIGLDSTAGIPPPPPITSAVATPIEPSPLPDAAKALAADLDARLAVISVARDLLVTSGTHEHANAHIIVTTIASAKTEKKFDRDAPILALAMSHDGHQIVTSTQDAIVPAGIEDRLFDSGNEGVLPDSAGATSLVFLDGPVFASGDADGVVKVWNANTGMKLYQLPKLPSAITSLVVSPDGMTLTANFANGARSFTVKTPAVWAQ